LKGEEIPLAARVVAVADEWDKTPSGQALRNQAGKRFDPRVVAAFLNEIL
jgi:response regulator RpfG family c-di-GMP phosphodiesterase